MKCPICHIPNDDNWLVEIDGRWSEDMCQECWESECDKSWCEMMIQLEKEGRLNHKNQEKNEIQRLPSAGSGLPQERHDIPQEMQ